MDTIKSSADISSLFKHGRRIDTSYLTFIVLGTKEQHDRGGRVAFIAGKRLGNAVWRNRAKRRMRGLCQDLGGPFPSFDVIFLAKGSVVHASYGKMIKKCKQVLIRNGIIEN